MHWDPVILELTVSITAIVIKMSIKYDLIYDNRYIFTQEIIVTILKIHDFHRPMELNAKLYVLWFCY